MVECSADLAVHCRIGFAEVPASFRMTQHHQIEIEFAQHRRGNLPRKRAAGSPVHVLCSDPERRPSRMVRHRGQRGERREHEILHAGIIQRHRPHQPVQERNGFGCGLMHLQVGAEEECPMGFGSVHNLIRS